uniref:RRM domain-containing protein n=1 Tax=Aplanochytrium stocchinoi TaxID=215587 RepID=A0A7S3LNF7_9STRA|mmetsp:Transcript_15663/g.19413  ORF Transcript_15663/g.19413 Transcript_15663/m.19413 type:complete len:241 (+) Transcript_15663:91-813(+)|eukprot:CAMPEP_0204829794 /NCGR_PEP_ID=MMETSP1346-20131115/8148_1 /ASSEMBLY_ACC=CAM_ASM_000771 /TAXON_ID=215587 /ORGANISM="Aplanochytrium stocchinoi, Strain GSBS06" /LENGTH=240 /DNA_ID=CAMNT_0051959879 /DNA_START=149 /DNA_END=871 /DNA_ORIENTATION=-
MTEIAPKQTLYIRNLNETIHPNKMREILYTAFSRFGPVLDVVCIRSNKLRGQAWIVYEDVSTATAAKKKLNNYSLCDKPMNIDYAKETSDAVLKLKNPQEYRERLRKRRDEARKRKEMEDKAILEGGAAAPPAKQAKTEAASAPVVAAPAQPAPRNVVQVPSEPPNKILFAQNLPADTKLETLENLFKDFTGYKEARLVPGHNVAFIEFEDEIKAGHAKDGLHNYKIAEKVFMNLTYAKR